MSSPAREPSGLPRSSLDRVFRALEEQGRQPRQRGTHIQARCPLHEDSSPSLSIDWKAASGMTLLACHSGSCPAVDEKDILEALGIALVVGMVLLDGVTVQFSMGAFGLAIDAPVVLLGIAAGLVVGLLGALPPALRCLRLPIADALKPRS